MVRRLQALVDVNEVHVLPNKKYYNITNIICETTFYKDNVKYAP